MQMKTVNKLLLVMAGALLLQGCGEEKVIEPRKPLTVSAITIEKPVDSQFRSFKGQVMPADLTPLSFRVAGELEGIMVRAGQKVSKGELLAKLDSDKLRQQLSDAQVQYDLALKQYRRGSDLLKREMVSQSEYDELNANLRLARVRLQTAQNSLEYTRLVAPFDGYVSEVPKKSYESVSPGETILSVYRDDIVRVRIAISDVVLALINPDRQIRDYAVKTTFSGDDGQYILKHYEHSSEPVEGGNVYEFWLQMDQVTPAILPGATANLDVDMVAAGLGVIQGYQIPMTAIDPGNKEGEFYIWKVTNGVVNRVPVDIVKINSMGALVSKGIKAGDKIVNSGLRKLRDNAVVALANEGKPQ